MVGIRLISFDFEGTLVDFQWKLSEAVGEALHTLGKAGAPANAMAGMNYSAIYNLVRQKEHEWGFPGDYLTGLLDEVYDKYDLDAASRWKPVHDIHSMLDNLGGYKLALVSNVGKKALYEVLLKFGLRNRFGLIVSRNDVKMLKPCVEGLQKAMEWAGTDGENTIHIGDSLSDILAARSAGAKACAVLGGEDAPEALLREKPDLLLKALSDLPGRLKSSGF
ncbi:MAG: HAD family hydrolase [Bacillota bacterium]